MDSVSTRCCRIRVRAGARSLKLRKERDLERVRGLLDVSGGSLIAMYIFLLLLLAAGIVAGFMGHWWGRGWIWAALGLLVAITVAMSVLASPYYDQLRKEAGLPYRGMKKQDPLPQPVSAEALANMLSSARPLLITAIGVGGLLVILWLMMLKPF